MLTSSFVSNINIFFIWTDDSELPGRSMFCIGHNERYLSGTNKWGWNLFLYLTKSLCELHHQRFIFNTIFPPFRWRKRWLPHHPEVSRAVKEKVAVVFRSDWVSPCRASFSSLEMPPRNQTRVEEDPEPVMPGLWPYLTVLCPMDSWWCNSPVCTLPSPINAYVFLCRSHGRGQGHYSCSLCIGLLSIWCAKARLSFDKNYFNLSFLFWSALHRDLSFLYVSVLLDQNLRLVV